MALSLIWDEGAILRSFHSVVSAKDAAFLSACEKQHLEEDDSVHKHFAAALVTEKTTLTHDPQPGNHDVGDSASDEICDDAEELRKAQHDLQEAFAGALSRAANGEVDEEEDEFWAAVVGVDIKTGHTDTLASAPERVYGEEPPSVSYNQVQLLPVLESESRKRLRSTPEMRPRIISAAPGFRTSSVKQSSTGSSLPCSAQEATQEASARAHADEPTQPLFCDPTSDVARGSSGTCTCGGCTCAGGLSAAVVDRISRAAVQAAVEFLLPPLCSPATVPSGDPTSNSSSSTRLSALLQAWYQAGMHAGRSEQLSASAAASAQ